MVAYKIAGSVIRTMFRHENVEHEFAAYLTEDAESVDIEVKVVRQSCVRIPEQGHVVSQDKYKTIVIENGVSDFIYRQNNHVLCSRLSDAGRDGTAQISIVIDDEVDVQKLGKIELRFAIMDPLFAYLWSKGIFPLHSCGLSLGGTGVLISGASGSGKSSIGRILVQRYGAKYIGDDVNACSSDAHVWGLPFSRINNSNECVVRSVVFLGDRTARLSEEDIVDELMSSEFAVASVSGCVETARRVASCFARCGRCFMVSRFGQTEEETAEFVHSVATGKNEL